MRIGRYRLQYNILTDVECNIHCSFIVHINNFIDIQTKIRAQTFASLFVIDVFKTN